MGGGDVYRLIRSMFAWALVETYYDCRHRSKIYTKLYSIFLHFGFDKRRFQSTSSFIERLNSYMFHSYADVLDKKLISGPIVKVREKTTLMIHFYTIIYL